MNTLDEKLDEIIRNIFAAGRDATVPTPFDWRLHIKQVFADEGYVLPPINLGYIYNGGAIAPRSVKRISHQGKDIPFENIGDYVIFDTGGHKVTDFTIDYEGEGINCLTGITPQRMRLLGVTPLKVKFKRKVAYYMVTEPSWVYIEKYMQSHLKNNTYEDKPSFKPIVVNSERNIKLLGEWGYTITR